MKTPWLLTFGTFFAFPFLYVTSAQAQVDVASDSTANYPNYSSSWTNGANGGFGFQPWNLTNATTAGGSSGWFIGNPGSAGINTNTTNGGMTDPSFALYANHPNAGDNANYVSAKRALSNSLAVGQTLIFRWAVNWDSDGNGNKGFNIRTGGINGSNLVNVNQGWSANITVNGANVFTNYGTNPMTWSFRRVNSNTLQISSTPRTNGTSFITNITINGAPDAFEFYASGLSINSPDNRQPYFNNFRIMDDRITLVGDFLPSPWNAADAKNVMTRGADGNTFTLSNVYVINPAAISFKFVNGSFGAANWGLGTNPIAVNTNTGSATGIALRDGVGGAAAANLTIPRASGFYTFTFNTNTLAFSVSRQTFSSLGAFAEGFNLRGNLASGGKDPDQDRLDNQSEWALNTDPTLEDTDGDGIPDGDEYVAGTNPLLEDTDGDGLRDNWERTWGFDPTTPYTNPGVLDGAWDPDADQLTNLEEQIYGTDPLVPNARPSLSSSVRLSPDGFNQDPSLKWQNRLRQSMSDVNLWSGLIYVKDASLAPTNRLKFITSNGSTENGWGKGPMPTIAYKDAYPPLETTNLRPTNYARFQINVVSGEFSIDPMSLTDTNGNGVADEYERWYGARLAAPVTTLDPAADYDQDGLTVAQELVAGSNPVEDVEAPTIQLNGDEIILVQGSPFADPGVTASDNSLNRVSAGVWVSVVTNRARVDQFVSASVPGWNTVTYVATDAAGNSVTNTTRKVVTGDWTASYPTLHLYNLQSVVWTGAQGTGRFLTNNQAVPLDVYARYYRDGKTQGTNWDSSVRCWIGVSTNTNHPSSWGSQQWTEATYNASHIESDDEYKVTFSNLPANTYRVVSRWQFGSNSIYAYGGVTDLGNGNGGALGVTTGSGLDQKTYEPFSITLTPAAVTYAKIHFPTTPAPINAGDAFDVYFQFYSGGVTEATGAPTWSGVRAQLGYSLTGGDPAIPGAYTWVNATWNAQMTGLDANNDEYKGTLSGLTAGTYSYAVRFSVDGGATWVYGGANGLWNNDSVQLVVNAVGSTFAGWSGGATLNSANVGKYAIGGASSLTATDGVQPTTTVSGGNLVLTAIVRTDDAKVIVVGEAVTSLADYAPGGTVSTVNGVDAANQTGVPAGHRRQTFTVPQGADTRKFLRLKATLAP